MQWKGIGLVSMIAAVSPAAWSQVKMTAVVNSASFQSGMPLGGGLATVFVKGLESIPSISQGLFTAPPTFPLPFHLCLQANPVGITCVGIRVRVNGGLSPILAVFVPATGGTGQINIQVPLERNANYHGSELEIGYYLSPVNSPPLSPPATFTPLPESRWGGFFSDPNGYAIARHALDNSLVAADNPAHAGETIIAYADGFFAVWPPPPIGLPVPSQPLFQFDAANTSGPGSLYLQRYPQPLPQGSFTNTPALQVVFQGLVPVQVGLEQINFVVPADQQPGDWDLFFNTYSGPYGGCLPILGCVADSSASVKLPVR